MRPTFSLVVALSLSVVGVAFAAPETAAPTRTQSTLSRYQDRLEVETARVLTPEVSGSMKEGLAHRGTTLWACVSIAGWSREVLAEAPALGRACQVIARRAEVLHGEEHVADAFTSPILQLASVHAMQRGLGRVLAQLGLKLAPPPAPAPAPARGPTAVAPAPVAAPVRTTAPAARTAITAPTPLAPRAEPVRSPTELLAYTSTLDRETFRILSPELEGRVLEGVVARRATLRSATTVAAWKQALAAAHPALVKAAAVLERRAEVLRGEARVLDAYDTMATQRAALAGLNGGLDRLLRQFGR